jgi:phage-related protein
MEPSLFVFELRSKQSSNIQRAIYFREIANKYIITHGFTKKADVTPESEKIHARNMRQQYKERIENERHGQID